MSYLLEVLGRGLLADLRAAFARQLPGPEGDDLERLRARHAASPDSFDLALRLGMACLRAGQLAEARTVLDRAAALNTQSPQPHLALACVHDELGQLPRALEQLAAAREIDGSDPAIAFGVGFCHERLQQSGEAEAAYSEALNLCPQLRNAYERLAALALQRHDWEAAISQYERLAEMEPGDLDVLLTLGNLYLQVARPLEAVAQYQQALLIEPDGHDSMLKPAEALAEDGRLTDAIATLERLVHKYPGMAPFHVRLGDLYGKSGNDVKAVEEYRRALETQPSFLEATVKLGTQHMRQGRFVDAAVTFNRAVELNDRLMTAFVGLGVAQHDAGRKQESLATFDLAASLEPSSTLLFSESTRLHLKSERGPGDGAAPDPDEDICGRDALLEEALRRHGQALAAAPNHADLHYRHGLLLRQLGRYEEAIAAFQQAVAINPNYSKALVKLAICLKECGRIDDAVAMFQRALRLDDSFVDVHYQLGLLFAQRNQFDLAVEEFERALALRGDNASFRANLALALQNIGMVDRAAATWHSLCELSPAEGSLLETREHALRRAQKEHG
ncbi:MAG: tetratricopeptide repeat protein [Planctomycetota bacterium]